jgi:hypothetical protein
MFRNEATTKEQVVKKFAEFKKQLDNLSVGLTPHILAKTIAEIRSSKLPDRTSL